MKEGFASVHVFVVAHVRVVGLHLALNHGLLPPAAGHHQADEESLRVPQRGGGKREESRAESISLAPFEQEGKGFKGEEEAGSTAEKCTHLFLKKFLQNTFYFF